MTTPERSPGNGIRVLRYWRLYREVRGCYTRRGALIWIRHHRRRGTPLDEQFRQIEILNTGAFS